MLWWLSFHKPIQQGKWIGINLGTINFFESNECQPVIFILCLKDLSPISDMFI